MHNACNPKLADHTTHHTTTAPDPHHSTLSHRCHLYSPGLTPQCLVELQFRDRLCIDTPIVQQPIMPGFRSQACRLMEVQKSGSRRLPSTASMRLVLRANSPDVQASSRRAPPRLGRSTPRPSCARFDSQRR